MNTMKYLEKNFKEKSSAYSHEYQKIFDDCVIKKMKFKHAKKEAWEQTQHLRDLILKMPSVKMYFLRLKGENKHV